MDTQNYFSFLDSNTQRVLALVHTISPNHLSYQEQERWSILQILEHICMTDQLIHARVLKPCERISDKERLIGNENMQHLMVEKRNQKITAPDILLPQGNVPDVITFKNRFIEQRNLLKEDLLNGKIVTDNRIFEHRLLGDMTISDWLYFIVFHTRRHEEQIKETLQSITTDTMQTAG